MYRKTVKNLVSDMKPCESFDVLSQHVLMMPMVDNDCDMCGRCAEACSGHAISIGSEWSIDLGKCIFCRDCYDSCKHITSITAPNYAFRREDLIFTPSRKIVSDPPSLPKEKVGALRGSISIRELDTGSCNACESEINAMGNKYYDMERFCLKFVPSPRQADLLLVTGPMTRNMLNAAMKTYSATPGNKFVVACGTCAISGGLFVKGDVVGEGIGDTLPVDMFIVGCPPAPSRIIASLIEAFGIKHH